MMVDFSSSYLVPVLTIIAAYMVPPTINYQLPAGCISSPVEKKCTRVEAQIWRYDFESNTCISMKGCYDGPNKFRHAEDCNKFCVNPNKKSAVATANNKNKRKSKMPTKPISKPIKKAGKEFDDDDDDDDDVVDLNKPPILTKYIVNKKKPAATTVTPKAKPLPLKKPTTPTATTKASPATLIMAKKQQQYHQHAKVLPRKATTKPSALHSYKLLKKASILPPSTINKKQALPVKPVAPPVEAKKPPVGTANTLGVGPDTLVVDIRYYYDILTGKYKTFSIMGCAAGGDVNTKNTEAMRQMCKKVGIRAEKGYLGPWRNWLST